MADNDHSVDPAPFILPGEDPEDDDATVELSLHDVLALQRQDHHRRRTSEVPLIDSSRRPTPQELARLDAHVLFEYQDQLRERSDAEDEMFHKGNPPGGEDATSVFTIPQELLAACTGSGALASSSVAFDDGSQARTPRRRPLAPDMMPTLTDHDETVEVTLHEDVTREAILPPREVLEAFARGERVAEPVVLDFQAVVDEYGRLVIPRALVDRHGLRPGTRLRVHVEVDPERS